MMPVIRGEPTTNILSPELRESLLRKLASEHAGPGTADGPLIFEIPLGRSDKIDVLVVWKEFEDLRSEDRTELILDAYNEQKDKISLAMGVTYQEAIGQQLLPYTVIPMTRRGGGVDPAELRKAMLDEGGIPLSDEKVDLRFPTMAMAEAAHRRLIERLPGVYWSIIEGVASTP